VVAEQVQPLQFQEHQQLMLVVGVVVLVMVHQDAVLFQEEQEVLVEVEMVVHIQEDKVLQEQLTQAVEVEVVLMDLMHLQQEMVLLEEKEL
jgi:hypothetical protein